MKRKFSCIVILFLFLPFAFAQEEQVRMENIFDVYTSGTSFTFTRTERDIRLAPQAVTVITREQIEQSGATTLSEVLRFVPGFNSRVTPMGSQMGVRSFGSTPFSERVLFLINGTPYNSPDKGGYPGHPAYEDFFPLDAIKRVEVIKGPGSSLYGYNAFFGVINIITEDFIVGGKGTNDVIAKGGSRNSGSGVIRGGGVSGDWKYSYLGKYKQQLGPMRFLDDPSQTPGLPNLNLQPGVGLNTGGTDVKNGDIYFRAQHKDLSFSYVFHKDETDSFTWIKPRTLPDLRLGDQVIVPSFAQAIGCCETIPTEQTLQFLDASYKKEWANRSKWQVKAFYNRRKGNTCGNCHDNINTTLNEEDETNQRLFLNTQYELNLASHKIIFGGDFQLDKTEKNIAKLDGTDIPAAFRIPTDSGINSQAAYVQDEISLSDNRLILTLGVRLDHNEVTDNVVSPNLSIVAQPTEKFVVRALYGRAFRQPTWNDLFTVTTYTPVNMFPNLLTIGPGLQPPQLNFYQQQGNPNTDTEQIDTFEAGFEYDFTSHFSLKVDGFYSRAKDLIEAYDFQSCDPNNPQFLDPLNPLRERCANFLLPGILAVTRNLEGRDFNSKGAEIELRVNPSPILSAIFGYSYQKNEFDLIDPPFVDSANRASRTFENAYSPENKITLMINVTPVEPLLFNFSLNYWDKYDTRFFASDLVCAACTNTNQIGQSYTYANLSAFYNIPLGDQKLKLGLTIKNIFDEEVQISHAFRVDGALTGREFFGLAQFSF